MSDPIAGAKQASENKRGLKGQTTAEAEAAVHEATGPAMFVPDAPPPGDLKVTFVTMPSALDDLV